MEQVGRQLARPRRPSRQSRARRPIALPPHSTMPPRRSARSAASASARTDGCTLPERASTITFRSATASRATRCWTKARALGIPNATHNNTRGYITRLLERRLIAAANGRPMDEPLPQTLLQARQPGVLNRVLNLETGSLAVEAALKMMLSRFDTLDGSAPAYPDRIPVFLVMADNDGGVTAGYHGTTILAQMLRGLWPSLAEKMQRRAARRGRSINDPESFRSAIERWNTPPYKTAGFCHELIMMNYSGTRLNRGISGRSLPPVPRNGHARALRRNQSSAW